MIGSLQVCSDIPVEQARAFLRTDIPWNCFTLADLAPPYSEHARLPVAFGSDGQIVASCLLYDCPGDRSLVPFGSGDGIRAILAAVELPEQTFAVTRERYWPVVSEFFEPIGELRTMRRMSLTRDQFVPTALDLEFSVEQMGTVDHSEIDAFYQRSGGFMTDLFPEGAIFGVRNGEKRLCAVAVATAANGVEGIGTIGGVFTDPAIRGRGLGKAVTSQACQYWFDLGRDEVYLNVHSENAAARSVYRALGFTERLQYQAIPARRRSA